MTVPDSRQPVILGVADVPLTGGKAPKGLSVLGLQARAAQAALADAGLGFDDVDALFTTAGWGIPGVGLMPASTVAEYLGLDVKMLDTTSIGGASFEAHAAHAALAIRQGYCDVALITFSSLQRTARSRSMGGRPGELSMQYEVPYGLLNPVGAYGLAATRYMHEYRATSEELAMVAVATREWARLNPAATKREPLTVEEVLASPLVSDPLHTLDCCLVTDGAGAVVITSASHARAISGASQPVNIIGYGEASTHNVISQMPSLTSTPASESGRRAFEQAGVTQSDIDVAELYDSFTITVLLTLEALGFCKPGEAASFVASGATAPHGELPTNTNGGGLSFCHPGMYGIFLLIEATRQLRGGCADRQVPNARIALVNGTGGTLSNTSTCILST
jgi:acetyl-CoA acetyltransferase